MGHGAGARRARPCGSHSSEAKPGTGLLLRCGEGAGRGPGQPRPRGPQAAGGGRGCGAPGPAAPPSSWQQPAGRSLPETLPWPAPVFRPHPDAWALSTLGPWHRLPLTMAFPPRSKQEPPCGLPWGTQGPGLLRMAAWGCSPAPRPLAASSSRLALGPPWEPPALKAGSRGAEVNGGSGVGRRGGAPSPPAGTA